MSTLYLKERLDFPAQARSPERTRAGELAKALAERIEGEVRFDDGSRALYASDHSVYRQVPIGVVIPRTVEDVVATLSACRQFGVPILGRGCGTSLAGQCCNVAVVIDFSKYVNRLLEFDPAAKRARFEPGLVCDALRTRAREHDLTLAPSPATHAFATLGGMIGNNSCGAETFCGGKTVDNVEALEVLTYDGLRMRVGPTPEEELSRIIAEGGRRAQIYSRLKRLRDRYAELIRARYPKIPRRVSGFNLDQLLPENGFNVARALVGSESTCVIVLQGTMRLVDWSPNKALLVIGYRDHCAAADHVPEVSGLRPRLLEGLASSVIENLRAKGKIGAFKDIALFPEGKGWLLAEFGGATQEEAVARARAAMARVQAKGEFSGIRLVEDPDEQAAVFRIREAGVGSSYIPQVKEAFASWEDSAVPPERLGRYLRDLDRLLKAYGYEYTLFGHFGDGCIHARVTWDLKTAQGIRNYLGFLNEASDLVVSHGGSLSGEHGDGQVRANYVHKMYGPELMQALREFKSIWDPDGRMNPGKMVDPYPADLNLRLGKDYRPWHGETHFKFPEDGGSFASATERCFGVGQCRRLDGGTMCPSFRATREEKHTTRGRARMLFEMLRGDALTRLWNEESVKESLDLCLACKGCKGDCPVSVDIATYKSEFLSHYYEKHARPLRAYAIGYVYRWARVAAWLPGLANFLGHAPVVSTGLKRLLGIAPQRALPRLARRTFREWFFNRAQRNPDGPRVVLWPDTFNDHFYPQTAICAVEVLESAGYRVEVPGAALCCARPLFDFGMLERAKIELRRVLDALAADIEAGTPLVVLEPSCLAVFKDELVNLFPDDEQARRLERQAQLFSEFLVKDENLRARSLGRTALLHGHCHQKALMGLDSEAGLLARVGVRAETPDDGCCGMAGSFGYEKDKYAMSLKIGERVLLPAVRDASPDALIVANGFSCREQIADATGRRALHIAEVVRMATRAHSGERASQAATLSNDPRSMAVLALAALAAAGGAWLAWRRRH